jgi:hypothetical protein
MFVVVLLGCVQQGYLWPRTAFVAAYGRLPVRDVSRLDRLPKGTTKAEFRAAFGQPHKREVSGADETWWYFGDCLGVSFRGLDFNAKGRLVDTHEPW